VGDIGSVSDEALLAAVGAGDSGSLGALLDRHGPRVHGLARTLLWDAAAAEDAVQATFLRVWRFAHGFDPRRGTASSWLYTIARNVCVDACRSRGLLVPIDPVALAGLLPPDPAKSPEDQAQAATDIRRVRRAVSLLPPEQLRALLQSRWYGMSAAEIAAADGLSLGTVKSRLRLALARLRTTLDEHYAEGGR